MIRRWAPALLAALLLPLWAASPAAAQEELRAAERAREFAAVAFPESALERHLLARQELVLWLPADFVAGPPAGEEEVFERAADGLRLRVARFAGQPGASPIQTMQALVDAYRRRDQAIEVTSRRLLKLADRPAIEVAGSFHEGGQTVAVRLVLVADGSSEFCRSFQLEQRPPASARSGRPSPAGDEIDAVLSRLLRDFSPLDRTFGGPAFERQRKKLAPAGPGPAFDRRNRLLAEIAEPDAVGQPWVAERLAALAAENPALLVDGLVHPHPRVRLAVLAALDPLALPEAMRASFFALVMVSRDPVLRYRAALRVAAAPGLAGAVLDRMLESDEEISRDGAFQLLAALGPAERRAVLEAKLGRGLEDLAVPTQTLLLAAAARWSEPATAARVFAAVARQNRHAAVREAAYRLLLGSSDPAALAAAGETLRQPAARLFAASAAAEAWAALAPLGGAEELTGFRRGLEAARDTAEAGPTRHGVEVALSLLAEFAGFEEQRAKAAAAGEKDAPCRLLLASAGHAWAVRRSRGLACPEPSEPPLARMALPQPGFFLSSLLDQAARLEVGDPAQNQVYHGLLARISEALGEWHGDPFSMASTGLDLSAPLEIDWWGRESPAEARALVSQLRLRAADFETLEDSLLRLSYSPADAEKLVSSVLPATQLLPLVPMALLAFEDDLEDEKKDAAVPTKSPGSGVTRSYSAFETGQPGAAAGRTLLLLQMADETTRLIWTEVTLERRDDRLMVSFGRPGTAGGAALPTLEPAADAGASAGTRLAVDLSGFLRHLARQAKGAKAEAEVPPHLGLLIRSTFGDPQIATRFEVSGLDASWLAIPHGRPPAELAAPAELLPRDLRLWLGVSFDPRALAAVLTSRQAEILEALGTDGAPLLEARELLQGEAGVAVFGKDELVFYATVDPAAADRYLDRNWKRKEKSGALRYHREKDGTAVARIGRFLVVASRPELLARLAKGPFFAGSEAHRDLLARLPERAAMVGGFFSDLSADAVVAAETAKTATEGNRILFAEALRALGPLAFWLKRDGAVLAGEMAIEPRRLPAAAADAEPVGRAPVLANFTKGSVATVFPSRELIGGPWSRLELTLELPAASADPDFAWAGERLDQQRLGPRRFRLESRSSPPLPERSPVRLPIAGAELEPFLRKETDLAMHLDTVRQLAEKIRGQEEDPARMVRAIIDWASRSLKYTALRYETDVEEILASRRADCTEFTRLTIALARSLGIPARPVNGIYVGDDGAILHRWAEVYLDRWYEIDSTFGETQVSAAALRLKGVDSKFLTGSPGIRFVFEGAERDDGAFTRRLDLPEPPAAGEAASLAAAGGQLRLHYRGVAGQPVDLESADGGRSFRRAAGLPPEGAAAEITTEEGVAYRLVQDAGGLFLSRRPAKRK